MSRFRCWLAVKIANVMNELTWRALRWTCQLTEHAWTFPVDYASQMEALEDGAPPNHLFVAFDVVACRRCGLVLDDEVWMDLYNDKYPVVLYEVLVEGD